MSLGKRLFRKSESLAFSLSVFNIVSNKGCISFSNSASVASSAFVTGKFFRISVFKFVKTLPFPNEISS